MRRRSRKKIKVNIWLAVMMFAAVTYAHSQTDLSAWPQVRMELFVTDSKGNQVPDLVPGALLLKEDGRLQTISSVSPTAGPQSICVLIDNSGSMYERAAMVNAAASRLLQNLPSEDDVCVATFSWRFKMQQTLTFDRSLASAALKRVGTPSGGSALYDSIAALAKYMRASSKFHRRAMLIFTDGSDNISAEDQNDLQHVTPQLEADGNPVLHLIRVPTTPRIKSSGEDLRSRNAILSLAAIGAGLPYFPRNEREMDADVDDLSHAMTVRYVLAYITDGPTPDGRGRRVEAMVDEAHGRKKLVVHAPEGYYAPSQ